LLAQSHWSARCEYGVAAYDVDFGNLMADSNVSIYTMARLTVGRDYRAAVTDDSDKECHEC